jgi:hypothetical protein
VLGRFDSEVPDREDRGHADRAEQRTDKREQQVAQEYAESDHLDAERGQGCRGRRTAVRGTRSARARTPVAPNTLLVTRCSNSRLARGRENRSNQRLRRSNAVTSFCREAAPSSSLCERAGSQMHRRPTTSCSATSIVTASRTCVAPPVGSGSPGSAMSSTKMREAAWSEQLDEVAEGLRLIATEPVFKLVADRR